MCKRILLEFEGNVRISPLGLDSCRVGYSKRGKGQGNKREKKKKHTEELPCQRVTTMLLQSVMAAL